MYGAQPLAYRLLALTRRASALCPAAGGTWPPALLLALHVHLQWLQSLLTPACFDSLVHLVLDKARGWGALGWGSCQGPGRACASQPLQHDLGCICLRHNRATLRTACQLGVGSHQSPLLVAAARLCVSPQHPILVYPSWQVVARLEATLAQKRFNQLGGLQLEKDVRTLVGEWGSGPQWASGSVGAGVQEGGFGALAAGRGGIVHAAAVREHAGAMHSVVG